jgi:hypothetical protein
MLLWSPDPELRTAKAPSLMTRIQATRQFGNQGFQVAQLPDGQVILATLACLCVAARRQASWRLIISEWG